MPLLKAKIGEHVVSRVDIEALCKERLNKWKEVLVENESTPFALVSIGHNHRSGEIHVCVCDNISNSALALILRRAANELEP